MDEVIRSLAQPSWRQRNAQNLVEIEHLDHLADKIRREVVSYEKSGSSAPVVVKPGRISHPVEKKARIELSSEDSLL